MNRQDALEIAKTNHKAHIKANIETAFGRAPAYDEEAVFGYRHGWYTVGEFNFGSDEVTGEPYDYTQGGWAYL